VYGVEILHAKHHRQIVSVVVTVALAIKLFEVIPERSVWSILVRQSDDHIFAVPASGGFSLLPMQKEEDNVPTNEEAYKKQYHYRKRILIVDVNL
jgi:hypothetical protein